MAKKKTDAKARAIEQFVEAVRVSDHPGELLGAFKVVEEAPHSLAYFTPQQYLLMEPAQLLAALLVNVLRLERKSFAKQLGISAARLSQYTQGGDHVPDKRRQQLATLALDAAAMAEDGFQKYEKESPQEKRVRLIVGSLISNVARAIRDLADIEITDLVSKGVISSEDEARAEDATTW